jgi:hypothetical protein
MFEKCEQVTLNPDSLVSSSSNNSQKGGRSNSISNSYNDFYNCSTSRFNNSSSSSASYTNNQRSLNDRNLYSYQRSENKLIDFDQELKIFLKENEHSIDVNKSNELKNESLNQLDEIVSIYF